MFTREFWSDAGERALSTFGQATLAVLPAAGLAVLDTDWKGVLSVGVGGAILSLLQSLAVYKRRS